MESNLLKDKHISRKLAKVPISDGILASLLFEKLRYCKCFPCAKIGPGKSLLILLLLKFSSNSFPTNGSRLSGNSDR